MKRCVILLFIFSFSFTVNAQQYRNFYEKAASSETYYNSALTSVDLMTTNNSLKLGYQGALKAISAKYTFNPVAKVNRFNNGVAELEKAISLDKNNIELIYVRYTIELNAPSMLGYNKNTALDKNRLLIYVNTKMLAEKDMDLSTRIAKYLYNFAPLTPKEKMELKSSYKL